MPSLRNSPALARTQIGVLAGPLTRRQNAAGESALGDVVADALQAGAAPFDRNVAALVSLDDIEADLTGQGQDPVDLTFGEAVKALPMNNRSTVVTLTGDQLRSALEAQFAGRRPDLMQVSAQLAYTWSPQASGGQYVDPASITISGKPVVATSNYVIAVSNGLRGRSGNPVISAAPPITQGIVGVGGAYPGPLLDNLAAYLSARNPLPVPTLSRITQA